MQGGSICVPAAPKARPNRGAGTSHRSTNAGAIGTAESFGCPRARTRDRTRRRLLAHWLDARSWLLSLLVLLLAGSPAPAVCVDPSTLSHSTVSITRHFDQEGQRVSDGLLGIRGTAWFLSPTSLVTAGHVAVAMNL